MTLRDERVPGGSAGRLVFTKGKQSAFAEPAAITGANTEITFAANTAEAVRLDSVLGAVAGDIIELKCDSAFRLAWAATEAAANTASGETRTEKTAMDSEAHPAGVQQYIIPTSLTGQIWLSVYHATNADTVDINLRAK